MTKQEEIKNVYNSFFNTEKTNEKMFVHIGGEYNEPFAKEANIGTFNTKDAEGKQILKWASEQENIIIVNNARW